MRLSEPRGADPVVDAVGDGPHACVAALRGPPPVRDVALAKLHALLLGGARFELNRRCEALSHVPSGELDDLAIRAADDALVAILPKLDSFNGASRFTTWAYKFVLLEAAARARCRAWRGREISFAVEMPERVRPLRDVMHESLTPHERDAFAALVLNDVPIDVLAERLGTTRGALYATLHDARRTLREAMLEAGSGPGLGYAD